MGYTTEFKGTLMFNHELMASDLAFLKQFLSGDYREHPEWSGWERSGERLSYIQFEFTDNLMGIQWDGSEKFYYAVEAVNLLTRAMQSRNPDFRFVGSLAAQGEEMDDRWTLVIGDDGIARRVDVPIIGQRITCPHCEEEFVLEAEA